MSRKKYVAAVGIAVPLMLGVTGPLASAQPVEMQPQAQAGNRLLQDTQSRPALDVLNGLEVRNQHMSGYQRDAVYSGWTDPDGNGCDTREDILLRDLEVTEVNGCSVVRGVLQGPYTGESQDFIAGQSSSYVDIDHVVALSDAWKTGGGEFDDATWSEFGQDPLNLLAVNDKANGAKGGDAANEWLPDNTGYHCEFVARQVAVKDEYNLWVTQPEYDAIDGVLQTCPDQMTPTRMMGQVSAPAAQAPEPAPSTTTRTIAPEPEAPSTPEQPAPAEPAQPEQFEAQPEELAVTGTSATGMMALAVSLVVTALAGVGLARRHDKKAV